MDERATVQAIFDRFLDPQSLDAHRRRVCGHLSACRTEAMGGSVLRCEACGEEQQWYHGCRDRHCPQCQSRATRRWAARQNENVLPVPYYHLVFTLPHDLNGWVQLHPEVIYRLLFRAAWATVQAFGREPKRLGGEMGMSCVLHTWGQNLSRHVHLHCLVPGGALGGDGQWRASRGNYLFPVRALSRGLRGRMVGLLRRSVEAGELHRITRPGEVERLLDALMGQRWVVYTKACLSHTAGVVDYLARYTHRIAITNARILSVDEQRVTFRCKDYRDGNRQKPLTLDGEEFVRRFLLHIVPKGLMRVRHYGFLANRCRRERLAEIRHALAVEPTVAAEPGSDDGAAPYVCPHCHRRALAVIAHLPASARSPQRGERYRRH